MKVAHGSQLEMITMAQYKVTQTLTMYVEADSELEAIDTYRLTLCEGLEFGPIHAKKLLSSDEVNLN